MKHLIGITLAIVMLVVGAPAAIAHTDLVSSTPMDGETLEIAPLEVVLTFNEDLLADTVKASITDESGTVVAVDAAQANGAEVRFPWPKSLPGGTYTVNYRVVSGDGHPVTGSIGFGYTTGLARDAASSAASAPASAAPSTAPSTAPSASAPPVASPIAAPVDGESSGVPWLPIVGFLIAVAALVAVIAAARRGRR